VSLHVSQQLKGLSEISTLLARFESVDRTMPEILSLMTRTLHVRGATLICNRSGRTVHTGWRTESTSPAQARLDELHARTAYGYLTGVRALTDEPIEGVSGNGARSLLSSKDLRAGIATDEVNNFVVLPLVVEDGPVFGALQVEGDVQLDETDLLFVNTVVRQLAVALDRQAVVASRDAVVKASRLHAEQRFGDLQRTERAQHFLSDVSARLADSLDYRNTLATVLGVAVPFLADVCFIDDAVDKDNIVRIDSTCAEGRSELASEYPPRPRASDRSTASAVALFRSRQPQDEVLATGKAIVLPDPAGAASADTEAHGRMMREAGFASMMVLPLIARGEALGTLTLAMRGPKRRYTSLDLALAQEVAHRAAIAIDHARLHRQTQRAVQDREVILNIVSHDLRNPLNTLLMSAALLREDLPADGGSETSVKALAMIQRSVGRMERLIGDLLDMASIEAGQLAISKLDLAFNALVEEAIESSRSEASRKSLRLEVQLPSQEILLSCDRGRILQVLSNLIDNAFKFTPKGGSLLLSAERHETEIRVAVSDTGTGIAQEALPHVFDRYWRAKETASRGSGLGLYISKGIIESHGGALWVESELGKGSTFFFTLPCI
jgi:signal transduction histidine kinase